jgi:uncharacterized protein YjbJ (UPF0337 family)
MLRNHIANSYRKIDEGINTMKSSTKDHVNGTFHQMKGKLKEIAGELSGNPKLEYAGAYEKMSGIVQQRIGQVKKDLGK